MWLHSFPLWDWTFKVNGWNHFLGFGGCGVRLDPEGEAPFQFLHLWMIFVNLYWLLPVFCIFFAHLFLNYRQTHYYSSICSSVLIFQADIWFVPMAVCNDRSLEPGVLDKRKCVVSSRHIVWKPGGPGRPGHRRCSPWRWWLCLHDSLMNRIQVHCVCLN